MNKLFIRIIIPIGCLIFMPNFVFASPNGLVVSEFQIGKSGEAYNEYVVIKNTSNSPINLDGYLLYRKNKSGTKASLYQFQKGVVDLLQPSAEITLANKSYKGDKAPRYYTTASSYISTDNSIYLVNSTGLLIDLVGYDDGPEYEGNPLLNVASDVVYRRNNFEDTEDNSADFTPPEAEKVFDPNQSKLIITELLPSPNAGEEFIEVFNPTSLVVNLVGLKLCDQVGSIHCYAFKEDEVILPFSYKSFDQSKTRITLNNDEDGATILNQNGEILFMTNIFESATKGESFSYFGETWKWSLTVTKTSQNVFVSTLEQEKENASATSNAKVSKQSVKLTASSTQTEVIIPNATKSEVKGIETNNIVPAKSFKISNKELGWAAIILSIFIICGYTVLENKDKVHEILIKIRK